MARAKKVSKATEDEHLALESAMNELSRQTDALLSTAEPKKADKPRLPKKRIVPHKNGASLDIVGHAPSSIKRTMNLGQTDMTKQKEELLTAKAGYSFNERPKKIIQDEVKVNAKSNVMPSRQTPEIIKSHEGKSFDPVAIDTEEGVTENKTESNGNEHIDVLSQADSESIYVDTIGKKIDLKASHKEVFKSEVSDENHQHPDSEERVDDQQSNNLQPEVKEDDDGIVRLKEDESEKPTVFDTAEYQAELHDWSKLSSNSHWSVFILVVLISVAGVLMYLYFTNKLPQLF